MPVEIRELVIKATVVQENSSGAAKVNSSGDNGASPNEELINICVEKILESIKDKNER